MHKIIIFLLFLIMFANANAQHEHRDTWHDDWLQIKHPVIEVSYGISKTNLDGFSSKFENVSSADIKLGFSNESQRSRKGLTKYIFAYFNFGNHSSDIDAREKTAGNLESSSWRFGFGRKEGYPIRFGDGSFSILPYTSGEMTWTRLGMNSLPDSSNLTDMNRLLLFDKSFRFGHAWEGGISVNLSRNFALNAGYERSNTYQRYLFWKNTGSVLIEEAGVGLIDGFVRKILHREPVAGSIVNFVLKNAYYFGIYQLRSKEMNWPFGGEAALNFDSFKFGVTVTF